MAARQFVGSEVSVSLSDGRVVEGVVKDIEVTRGLLSLTNAGVRRADGSKSVFKDGLFEVEKGSVKDLQLISLASTSSRAGPSHTSSSTATAEPESSPAKRKARNKKDRATGKAHASPYTSGYEGAVGSTSTPPPPPLAAADFSKDFDFQSGLQAFDKARVWADIRQADATDPATRLVAHNRKPQDQGMRKLANDEMVLSSEEQLVNGITAASLDTTPLEPALPSRPRISTQHGPVTPMSFAQLTEALHTASAETGPNLVQRVESAGRSISTYALTVLASQAREQPAMVAVLASCGVKGSYALRAAACLANRGVKVVALIVSPGKPPHAFEFYIRLVMASGGDVVSKLSSMPQSCDLVIEALADNAVTSPPSSPPPDPTFVSPDLNPACVTYTHHKPTLSIDMPSNVDYDLGSIALPSSPAPYATHLVCLVGLPKGLLALPHAPKEVCLADLGLPKRCYGQAGVQKWTPPWGQEWEVMYPLH